MTTPDPPEPPETMRRLALVLLTAASATTLLGSVVDAPWTPKIFAAAVVVFPIALMLLGAGRSARRSGVRWTLGLLLLLLGASMAGLFWAHARGQGVIGVLILVVGLFVLPLLVSTLGFAATYDDETAP